MTFFIATDRDRTAIFGVGRSEASAIADANQPAAPNAPEYEWQVEPCTEALFNEVNERGGNILWGYLPSKIACTIDEEAAADVA